MVLLLGRTVVAILEAKSDRRLAAALVAEHLHSARDPRVNRLLNVFDGVASVVIERADGQLLEKAASRSDVKALLGQHRTHGATHRCVGENALHLELILPDEIDCGCEDDVIDKVVEGDVERIEDVIAELHGQ